MPQRRGSISDQLATNSWKLFTSWQTSETPSGGSESERHSSPAWGANFDYPTAVGSPKVAEFARQPEEAKRFVMQLSEAHEASEPPRSASERPMGQASSAARDTALDCLTAVGSPQGGESAQLPEEARQLVMQLKDAHEASICDLHTTLEAAAAKREELTSSRCAALEATCQDLRQIIAALKSEPKAAARSIRAELSAELQQMREERSRRVAELTDEANRVHEAMLSDMQASHQSAAAERAASHEAQFFEVRAILETARADWAASHEAQLTEVEASLEEHTASYEAKLSEVLASLKSVGTDSKPYFEAQLSDSAATEREAYFEARFSELQAKLELASAERAASDVAQLPELGASLERLELQQLREEADRMLSQLRAVLVYAHESQLTEFPESSTDLERKDSRSYGMCWYRRMSLFE